MSDHEVRRDGTVYKLVSSIGNMVFVGSTFLSMKDRIHQHVHCPDTDELKYVDEVFDVVGWVNVRIIIIRKYPCVTKETLKRREMYYVRKLKPTVRPYSKRVANRHQFCEHGRWSINCRLCAGKLICGHGSIRQQCVICKGSKICEHGVRERTCRRCEGVDTVRIKCGCGSTVVRGQLNRHDRTKKHQRYLAKHKRWVCAAASMAAVVAPAIVPKMAEIAV